MSNELTQENARAILNEVAAQEERLQLVRFDNADAWRLGVQIVDAARARELPVVVSIRRHGQRLFHAALHGLSVEHFVPHGGVFPITIRGVGPVGTVGISGLAQADDHAFVAEQLEEFLRGEGLQPSVKADGQ